MIPPGDYESEMFAISVTDADIELLLSEGIGRGRLQALAPVLDRLRAQKAPAPGPETVSRVAAEASALARASRPLAAAATARRAPGRRFPARPQLAGAAISLVLVLGIGSAALAADVAAPGDTWYGLDRAAEVIGIGDGGAGERLEEARDLVDRGEVEAAIQHALAALSEEEGTGGDVEPIAQSRVVLESVAAMTTGASTEMRQEVAALLAYLSANVEVGVGDDGRAFGQAVADMARQIGGVERAPEPSALDPGPTSGVPGQGEPGLGSGGNGSAGNGNGSQGSGNGGEFETPADRQDQGNQDSGGQGNQDSGGQGNQGSGSDGDQGSGNGGNGGQGSGGGANHGNDAGGNAQGGGGTGPPEDSPSVTAPGRGNKP